MKDIILLVLGAIAGVLAQITYSSGKTKMSARNARRRLQKAARSDDPSLRSKNILAIYKNLGLQQGLYAPTTFPDHGRLPILYDQDHCRTFPRLLEPEKEDLVVLDELTPHTFPVDHNLIRKKTDRGAQLWDGPALHIRQTDHADDGEITFRTGICNYFAYVTLAQRIADETTSVARKHSLFLEHFRDFQTVLGNGLPPVTVAATATCVFESADGPVVAVHRRSDAVVNAAGMMGVAPIFGMESNRMRSSRSRYGLVYYNFLKEFIEEFFGLEQVIRTASHPRADLDWIFELPPAPDLIAQVNSGDMTLSCTGFGIDISDGSLTLALLAHFTSPSYLDTLRSTATGSWESVQSTQDAPAIDFIPLNDPLFDERAETIDPSSMFSLDLARLSLNGRTTLRR